MDFARTWNLAALPGGDWRVIDVLPRTARGRSALVCPAGCEQASQYADGTTPTDALGRVDSVVPCTCLLVPRSVAFGVAVDWVGQTLRTVEAGPALRGVGASLLNVPAAASSTRLYDLVRTTDPTFFAYWPQTQPDNEFAAWARSCIDAILLGVVGDSTPWRTEQATGRTLRRLLGPHAAMPTRSGAGTHWVFSSNQPWGGRTPGYQEMVADHLTWRSFGDPRGIASALLLAAPTTHRLTDGGCALIADEHVDYFPAALTLPASEDDTTASLDAVWTLVQDAPTTDQARRLATALQACAL